MFSNPTQELKSAVHTHSFNQIEKIKHIVPNIPYSELQTLISKQCESHQKKTANFNLLIDHMIPAMPPAISFNQDVVSIPVDSRFQNDIDDALKALKPWRKGPFKVGETLIDSEWKCQLKWQRIDALIPQNTHTILDIGCNSGYYLYRCLSKSPKLVVGIDPYLHYFYQYLYLDSLLPQQNCAMLPLSLESMQADYFQSNVILCLGLLYHQKSPLDCLAHLFSLLKPGGKLILETLITNDTNQSSLCPYPRYASMKNVYFIPSKSCLIDWLKQSQFIDIEWIDTNSTTSEEQRKTEWSNPHSLSDSLDPNNPSLTIEGYPAPLRGIVTAYKPKK